MSFPNFLKENGWVEETPNVKYSKGDWMVVFDTSSWMEVGTSKTPRVFDVPAPESNRAQWTLNLIVHLCQTDDRINGR